MRSILGFSVPALLGVLAALADSPAPPSPPRPVAGDEQDLLVLHESRPYRLRLHLQVEGRSFRAGWEAAAGHLFRFLDANGDGELSAAEAARAPSAAQWRQLLAGESVLEPDAPPEFKDLQANGKATPAALAAYYRRVQVGPLQIEWGPRTLPADPFSPILFQLLDTDKDGKLSRAELEAAPALLPRLDTDGVDIINRNELLRVPERALTPNAPPAPAALPFAVLDPADPVRTLTDHLLRVYDRDGNRRLGRKEIAFPKELFDALDGNRDGELDEGELARWRERPADLEVLVPLGGSEASFLLLPGADGRPLALANATRVLPGGTLHVVLPGTRLELVALEVVKGGAQRVRETLLAQFRKAENKGVLKARQMHQPPFTFVGLSRLADRDGDGDLSAGEMTDYLALQEKVVTASTFVTAVNRGRNLFEFLDADRDGRLSRRELRTAWQRLAPWTRDGFLTRDAVPMQFLLTVGHGRSPFTTADGPEMAQTFRPRSRPQGPVWFRKMDRNGDGDLSPREFLGTAEQFRRLDADGDGLISVEEAERADRDFRPPR